MYFKEIFVLQKYVMYDFLYCSCTDLNEGNTSQVSYVISFTCKVLINSTNDIISSEVNNDVMPHVFGSVT